jgi:hypothetical protein
MNQCSSGAAPPSCGVTTFTIHPARANSSAMLPICAQATESATPALFKLTHYPVFGSGLGKFSLYPEAGTNL